MPLTQENISAARNALNERTKDINKATAKINDASKKMSNITKDYGNNVKSFNDSVNSINLNSAFTDNLALGVSGLIADPFATAIQKIMSKINELVPKIESKIDKLEQDLVKKVDNKGRVTLQGQTIVITVTRPEYEQAVVLEKKIRDTIESIKQTILLLSNLIAALLTIVTAIQVFKLVLQLQEIVLSSNPASKIIYEVLKKAIKIIFFKEILNAYLKIMNDLLGLNKQLLDRLKTRFNNIRVNIKISDESDKGNFLTEDDALSSLADDLLGQDITSYTQEFTSNDNGQYILQVEKYGDKELIAKAYDKFSGLVAAQTAPSYITNPEDLLNELKTILNLGS